MNLFVTCASHLESLLKEELTALGIGDVQSAGHGVSVPNTRENIFKINYLSRLATRVLMPLSHFPCPDPKALYTAAKQIPWLDFLDENKTISIDANIDRHRSIRNSLYAAQIVKDAICDVVREKTGARPSVDTKNPDVQLNLFIVNNKATLSFDTSGAPLYKRGWKESSVEASLPETLAAAILIKAGYSSKEVLCDPFCGSGTLLIEAAYIASNTPAGFFREKWGFLHLPEFNQEEWETFKSSHDAQRRLIEPGHLIGADSSIEAIRLARKHIEKTGFSRAISLTHSPINAFTPTPSPTLVITDPPFGKRMQANDQLYKEFGLFLKKRCPAAAWGYLLTSAYRLAKETGCTVLSEWPLFYGGLNVCLYQLH
jgi:putative N6-adenine-specific DNA methylase